MHAGKIKIIILTMFSSTVFATTPAENQASSPIAPEEQLFFNHNSTEENTDIDHQRRKFSQWIDAQSHKMDDWFGVPNPDEPASASLRFILDTRWDRYNDVEFRPRIRGKLQLPTLEKRLSLVFGDDTLDNELDRSIAIQNENPELAADEHYDRTRTRQDNSSIALRWSKFSNQLGLDSDVDLGLRSGDDLYLRFKLAKTWQFENNVYSTVEQVYRYGIDSEHYLRSNIEVRYAPTSQAFISNQFSVIYADAQDDDLTWHNYSFKEHHFFKYHRFNYGIYTGGYYDDNKLRLNRWGPFVSWRQPVWRDWLLVQTDLNYLNDDRLDRSHYLGTLLRLEALF